MTIRAKLNPQKKIQVNNMSVSTQSVNIGNINSIDTDGVTDGSVLVYNANTQNFEVTTVLEKQQISGGHF